MVEITAKSVDEAKKAAAEKLGVPLEQVSVTVLEETKGLFGKSNVRVRAEASEAIAEQPKPVRASKAKAPAAPAPEAPVEEKKGADEPVEEIPQPALKRGRSRSKAKVEEPPVVEAPAEEPESEEIVASEADAEKIAGLLRELLASAKLQVNVKVGEINGRYVNIVLDGKDAAFLVGKHGEVLNAMQYLVNIMAGRRFNNGVRATLDCNDYRRRREEALTGLATKIAVEVKQRREEAVLDALPAFERRIVHKALAEMDGVTTYSEGEEPNRRVVIAPAE